MTEHIFGTVITSFKRESPLLTLVLEECTTQVEFPSSVTSLTLHKCIYFPKNLSKLNGLHTLIIQDAENLNTLVLPDSLVVFEAKNCGLRDKDMVFKFPHRLQKINLSNNFLDTYPESINECPQMLELNLKFNFIENVTKLPDTLVKFNLSFNFLKAVDLRIPSTMEHLDFSSNYIESFLLQDCKLKSLFLSGNKTIRFPCLRFLSGIQNIQMQFTNNKAVSLLLNLPKIAQLNIEQTPLYLHNFSTLFEKPFTRFWITDFKLCNKEQKKLLEMILTPQTSSRTIFDSFNVLLSLGFVKRIGVRSAIRKIPLDHLKLVWKMLI
jgi:hypothetical protein